MKKAAAKTRMAELNKEISEFQIKGENDRIFHLLDELEDKAKLCALRYGHCLVDDELGQQLIADYFVHICKSWMRIRYSKYECTWQYAVESMIESMKHDFRYSSSRQVQCSIVHLEAKLFPLDSRTVAGSFCD